MFCKMVQILRIFARGVCDFCPREITRKSCLFLLLLCTFILFGIKLVHKDILLTAREETNEAKSLPETYENYNGPYGFDHWKEYAPHYEFHLNQILNKLPKSETFRMLEIGVQSGGSVEVWWSYLSTRRPFYYVGMDIDERCKRSEDVKRSIFIEIASQDSPQDLLRICQKHGPFDFIVDDGGHMFEMMKISLDTLFGSDSCMTRNSLYVIEDMHTMVLKDFSNHPTDIPSIPAEVFRKMHYYWQGRFKGGVHKYREWDYTQTSSDKEWADRIESISLYNSMMFIHRGNAESRLTQISRGTDWIKYDPNPIRRDRISRVSKKILHIYLQGQVKYFLQFINFND